MSGTAYTIQTNWPIPAPGDISGRAAAVYESTPALKGIDARNPNTAATANCRITEMAMQDVYYYQGNVAVEVMPDTAVLNIPRFGSIWGVPQNQAAPATGNILVTGQPNAPFPDEVIFSASGSNVTWTSTAEVYADGSGSASVPVVASMPGVAGNLAAGSTLTITSPVENFSPQTGTVDSNGITGGLDIEDPVAGWRPRILSRIRQPAMGGSSNDFVTWTKEALPDVAYVTVLKAYGGLPNVGVVFAMAGPTLPTSGQVAAVQAYLQQPGIKPVLAVPVVLPAIFNPLAIALHLNPDTPAIRAAATAALTLSFAQDATIGGTTYFSRLDNAVSSSDGEYSHDMTLAGGTADVAAPGPTTMNTLGAVTFV